jgi:heterogeneous nuclear rnp K-like protein 2
MTESLFDTNFTSENEPKPEQTTEESTTSNTANTSTTVDPTAEDITATHASTESPGDATATLAADQSTSLPSLQDKSNVDALINYRVLVSAKEAGCLIGTNGQVIDSIRGETNTKAGISRLVPGSHERILTVSGKLDDCAKALSYFAQALINANIESYNYFPLKQLSSTPNTEETTILRLLIPNTQMGTLIGSKGARIQQIQTKYNISMIASKSFLPGSNERLVELQGSVDDLYDSLRVISRCLMEDFSSIVGVSYYVPRGGNGSGSGANSGGANSSSTGGAAGGSATGGGSAKKATLTFPNDIVGALIGKLGARINGVRKITGATIAISDGGEDERVFTITGSAQAVEKAKQMIYQNFKREEERRNAE